MQTIAQFLQSVIYRTYFRVPSNILPVYREFRKVHTCEKKSEIKTKTWEELCNWIRQREETILEWFPRNPPLTQYWTHTVPAPYKPCQSWNSRNIFQTCQKYIRLEIIFKTCQKYLKHWYHRAHLNIALTRGLARWIVTGAGWACCSFLYNRLILLQC